MHKAPSLRPAHRPLALLALLIGLALLAAVPAEGAVRVTQNRELRPDDNPIAGRDAFGMAVNPRNPRHIVAVYADWATLWCETAVSFNQGRTWRRRRLKAPEGFVWPPCTVGGHLASHIQGSIAFGRGKTVYTAFASGRVAPSGIAEEGRSVLVARSTDGGRRFRTGTVALPGGPNADDGPDFAFPKLAVVPGRRGGADRIILAASSSGIDHATQREREDAVVSTSGDGGRTWTPGRVVQAAGNAIEVSQPVLGRRGAVHLAWRTHEPGDRPGQYRPEGSVVVARSTDFGATWTQATVAGVRGYTYEGPRVAPFATTQTYTASTFPRLAADRRSGDVYLAYGNGGRPTTPGRARKADHFIHPDMDVWFHRSTDGGSTWSAPQRLNDEPAIPTEVTQTRHPTISVSPRGRVDVLWHDRRHWYRGCLHTHVPCLEARLGDTYYAFSTDRGATFSTDRRITDRSINNDVGYDYRFGTYWDHGPSAVPLGRNRLLVGWMDSRIGNVETDSQGIFLARVDHRPRPGIPKDRLRTRRAEQLAIALSRLAYPAGGEAVLGGTFASRPWTRVVIVNERDAAAVLAAGVLARANLATVLLAPSDGLTRAVKAEVARLQPIGAYVVGSEAALSGQVVEDLAGAGIARDQIVRLSGASAPETARAIAQAVDRRSASDREGGRPAFDAAILVNPDSADAYTAAALAATRRLPILFTGRDALPAATRDALAEHAVQRVLVAGGRDDVADEALTGIGTVQRLGGSTPLATSRAVVLESRRRGVADNVVFAATRRMDSALLGPAVARVGGLQLRAGRRAGRYLAQMRLAGDVDRLVHVRSGRSR